MAKNLTISTIKRGIHREVMRKKAQLVKANKNVKRETMMCLCGEHLFLIFVRVPLQDEILAIR